MSEADNNKGDSNRLENLFEKLDLNKDGKIDSEELAKGLDNLGYAHIRCVEVSIYCA